MNGINHFNRIAMDYIRKVITIIMKNQTEERKQGYDESSEGNNREREPRSSSIFVEQREQIEQNATKDHRKP